jgi:WD40 repeat protein
MAMMGPGVTPYGGHAGPVLAVAYAPGGATLASGGRDGVVQIWDAATRDPIHQLCGHGGAVHSLVWSPDGHRLATAGSDGTVRVWDARTGEQQQPMTPHSGPVFSVAWSPDGAYLATVGDDGKFRILDLATGRPRPVGARSGAVWSVAYAPDGATLATASRDGTVMIWDAYTGEERGALSGHPGQVSAIVFARDGTKLVTAGTSGVIRIWDLGTRREQAQLTGHTDGVWSLAYAPDGTPASDGTLASAGNDGKIRIWDPDNRREQAQLTGHTGDVWSLAYAPDGTLASAGNDGKIRIWDPDNRREQAQLTGHSGDVRSVAYAPDGRKLASGGEEDGTVRIWDARTGSQETELTGHAGSISAIAYAPDGNAVASASRDGVRIWDIRSGQHRLIAHLSSVLTVTYAPDGTALASGEDNGTVWIWNASTGEQKHRFTGQAGPVHSVAYAPDGTILAAGREDGTVQTWNSHDGEPQRTLAGHAEAVRAVAYAPDGKSLASGDDKGTIWIWDAATGKRRYQLTGQAGPVHSIAWSPDGNYVATGDGHGTTRILDASSGYEPHRLIGHTRAVRSVAYSPDGALATVGDMTIRIWNARSGVQAGGTGFGVTPRAARPLAGVRNDAPSEIDFIAATLDADTLAELIAAVTTSPPLAIALIGEWGAGKSSVMLQAMARVEELAARSRSNPGRSMFVANVRQVRFNAWNYCDDRLWSGLVEHLFRTLAADPDLPPDLGGTAADRVAIRSRLTRLEAEKAQLSQKLAAADQARQSAGWLAGLSSPLYLARIAAAAFRGLVHDARANPWVLAAWAALGGAAYAAWSLGGARVGAAVTAVAAVAAPVVAAVAAPVAVTGRRLRDLVGQGKGIAERLRSGLNRRQQAMSREIARLKERLALVDARARLSGFMTDRASPQAYERYRGLLGQVRTDLDTLSKDLAAAHREWEAGLGSTDAPLERIILYIDDLDRCPPHRVVEVLEAIHLMLTLDLFVVVVAVDARWLIKSLERHYRDMFSAGKVPAMTTAGGLEADDDAEPASPVDYLDKIFQIPYVLGRPPTEAMANFLRGLLKTETPPATGFTRGRGAGSARGAGQAAAEGDGSDGAARIAEAGQDAGRMRTGKSSDAEPGRAEEDDQEQHPHARTAEEPGPDLPDLRPLGLQLSQAEIEFMARLGAVMPTPRAAKRMANLYRLVRIGIPDSDLADFIGTENGGPYQVVEILLSVLAGSPATAQRIFQEVRSAAGGSDIRAVFAGATDYTQGDFCGRLHEALATIAGDTPLLTAVEEYQRWCPELARYSFHTRAMTGTPPPPGTSSAPYIKAGSDGPERRARQR